MLNKIHFFSVIYAIFLLLIGYCLARLLSAGISKALQKKISSHAVMLIHRATFYLLFLLFIATAIQELGFNIGTLLGAAGILTAAIGFASQTSMSNVISGLFIIGEKPFAIGDTIKVNDFQGQVSSIDLLSVKIRLSDNTMVRIPNEVLIKSAIINLSYFPFRRADLKILISLQENIEKVKAILLKIPGETMCCLADPAPSLQIQQLLESAVELQFSVWSNQSDFNEMKNNVLHAIQERFAENEIKLPLPIAFARINETVVN